MRKLALITVALILGTSMCFSQTNLSEGLVAYYPFDGDAIDYSGSGIDGTPFGGVDLTAQGILGQCANFDGINDYVELNALPFEDGPFTIALWAMNTLPESISAPERILIMAQEGHTPNGFLLSWSSRPENFDTLYFVFESTTARTDLISYSANAEWAHIAITYDFSELRMYINGALVQNREQTGNVQTINWPFIIGGTGAGNPATSYFQGLIDDFRVYNRAITQDEVTELYEVGDLLDSDNDGLPDSWEYYWFGDLGQSGGSDWDNDGLSDGDEYLYGTSPTNSDSDGDGYSDGYESGSGSDPNDDDDTPGFHTVSVSLGCLPSSGTLPFTTRVTVTATNNSTDQDRTFAGHLDFTTAKGGFLPNYRVGNADLAPGESFVTFWNVNVPAYQSLLGDNQFQLVVMDVTSSPYNQPPYPPAGDLGIASCTVTGIAP